MAQPARHHGAGWAVSQRHGPLIRCRRPLRPCAMMLGIGAAVALLHATFFAAAGDAPGLRRGHNVAAFAAPAKKSAVPPKRNEGFSSLEQKKDSESEATGSKEASSRPLSKMDRPKLPKAEALVREHGMAKAKAVAAILRGKRAKSPELMMRARFEALKLKDTAFLAATEEEPDIPFEKAKQSWDVALGLQEPDFWGGIVNNLVKDETKNLRDAESFDVIDSGTTDEVIEFKIRCKGGITLHEKSIFKEDKTWGYIYSGDSVFGKWE
mmetsp:Transcript_2201/g.5446  ORF Transcript_2201/g.5446 Transcript_2201/m.5446 type:complete len:267 (+) Transcript_2201:98-898(+)